MSNNLENISLVKKRQRDYELIEEINFENKEREKNNEREQKFVNIMIENIKKQNLEFVEKKERLKNLHNTMYL